MWNNTWPHIQHGIEEKICRETKTKYKILDKKLKKLTQAMTPQSHTHSTPEISTTPTSPSPIAKQLCFKKPKIQHTLKKEELDTESSPRGRNSHYPTSGQCMRGLQKISSGLHRHTTMAKPYPQDTPRSPPDKFNSKQKRTTMI